MLLIHEKFEHTYSYTSNGRSGHIAVCSCGKTSIEPHCVNASHTTGRYANCIQCGYLVDLGTDIVICTILPDVLTKSENDSYILSGGTVVVV